MNDLLTPVLMARIVFPCFLPHDQKHRIHSNFLSTSDPFVTKFKDTNKGNLSDEKHRAYTVEHPRPQFPNDYLSFNDSDK